ncbi:MAG: glycosyltransferase family 2 protein [Prochlorococcaceae cyanobacterium]
MARRRPTSLAKNQPQVSVVLGMHQAPLAHLLDTLASVLQQEGVSLECLLVADGTPPRPVWRAVQRLARRDPRLRLLLQPHSGLTRALRRGCRWARGQAIARIDVGDRMLPGRLAQQWQQLQDHPDCVLVTCGVTRHGPAWEPLDPCECGQAPAAEPRWVNTLPPEKGLAIDVPHHGSVLMRRSAYLAAGGYRSSFYYAQDWDLWYRLALLGRFGHCPQTLYACRLFASGLSSRHWREQRRLAALALQLYQARCRGDDEGFWLGRARLIRPQPRAPLALPALAWPDQRSAEGAYFIGECLRRRGDGRCQGYLMQALVQAPWLLKGWLRVLQAAVALS